MGGFKFDVIEDFIRVSYDFPFIEVRIYPPAFIDKLEDRLKVGEYEIRIFKTDDTMYALNMIAINTTWKGAEEKAKELVIRYFSELSKEIAKMSQN